MTNRKILFKHQLSGARDAITDIDIDEQGHTINITQRTLKFDGFISTALLEIVIFNFLPREINVRAYHNDDVASWMPQLTSWNVFVHLDGIRFRAECWNQRALEKSGPSPKCIELYLALMTTIPETLMHEAKQRNSDA